MNLEGIGKLLQTHRKRTNLSSAETASRLGVSPAYYSRLENGKERPSQDLLTKADKLFGFAPEDLMLAFQLAGYGGIGVNSPSSNVSPVLNVAPNIQINPQEQKVLYADGLFVSISDNGVVFDFGQRVGPTDQQIIVSRIGLSYSHAKKIHKLLGEQLNNAKNLGIEN